MDNTQLLPLTDNEMPYKHIAASQRNELSALLRVKTKQKVIAELLKKHRTTIWRERSRNEEKKKKYHAGIAKEKTTDDRLRRAGNNEKLRIMPGCEITS